MRSFFIIPLLLVAFSVHAQINEPVKWSFSAKKLETGKYEVHLTATISNGWHIYSQSTPAGGPLPTSIAFSKNPLVTLDGKVMEVGKLEQKHEKIFNVDVHQYSGKVDFVQIVKLNRKVKTVISGEIESMACDDHQCLPPKTIKFSIPLQ